MRRAVVAALACAAMLIGGELSPVQLAHAQSGNEAPAVASGPAHLSTFQLQKLEDGGLYLSFNARFELPASVQDALSKGVPLHFVAEAEVMRKRWYWRDESVSNVSRTWRLSYQPLTGKYKVSFGGLNQSFDRLPEAIAALRQVGQWKLVDAKDLSDGESYYVAFSYRLDTGLLPRPMQIGIAGQADWQLNLRKQATLVMP